LPLLFFQLLSCLFLQPLLLLHHSFECADPALLLRRWGCRCWRRLLVLLRFFLLFLFRVGLRSTSLLVFVFLVVLRLLLSRRCCRWLNSSITTICPLLRRGLGFLLSLRVR
jgi:hypothetical protein